MTALPFKCPECGKKIVKLNRKGQIPLHKLPPKGGGWHDVEHCSMSYSIPPAEQLKEAIDDWNDIAKKRGFSTIRSPWPTCLHKDARATTEVAGLSVLECPECGATKQPQSDWVRIPPK